MSAMDIPAERWNALQQALLLHREHRVPFHVRAEAIEAAEKVVSRWEDDHDKWAKMLDELHRLRAENDKLRKQTIA